MAEAAKITDVTKANTAKAQPLWLDQLTRLLTRKPGATSPQVQNAFAWKPHKTRAAVSTLRKAGFPVERSDTDKGVVYRIDAEV